VGGGVQLGPLGTAATNRPIVPAPGVYDDGEIGEMMICRRNRSTRRKPAPVPLCPLQTPHAARTRTRAAAMGSQRLTAWATARPIYLFICLFICSLPFKFPSHVKHSVAITNANNLYGNSCYLFWKILWEIHKYSLWAKCAGFSM
jgi:hypothetical protein